MSYGTHVTLRAKNSVTSQTRPIPGRAADMAVNAAGGHVFVVDDWRRLTRFLVLGTEGGTYYEQERDLTIATAAAVIRCIREDGRRVIAEIVDVSTRGRAIKQNPCLFALALCASFGTKGTFRHGMNASDMATALHYAANEAEAADVRREALAVLPKVARTLSALYTFIGYASGMRGWGKGLVKAVSRWFSCQDAERLSLQLVKYRQRDGWTARDLLRLTRPAAPTAEHGILYDWVCRRDMSDEAVVAHAERLDAHPDRLAARIWSRRGVGRTTGDATVARASAVFRLIDGIETARQATSADQVAEIVRRTSLPREAVPTEWQTDRVVWDALLEDMPIGAMIRTLNRMTASRLLTPLSAATRYVVDRLGDGDLLRKGRIHPMQILMAMRTYGSGHGARGKLFWDPVPAIVDALDAAFYASFGNVTPTGKRFLNGVDISSSMNAQIGDKVITCREAAIAMAMVTRAVEPASIDVGFTSSSMAWKMPPAPGVPTRGSGLVSLDLSPRRRLDDVCRETAAWKYGGTDCALPMLYALANGIEVDVFTIWTDNDTWAGGIHPAEALRLYRKESGIAAKLVVVGMTATGFSIADPADDGMLDIVGFDTDTPSAIATFVGG